MTFYAPVPDFIKPGSLVQTMKAASREVASICPVINLSLKATQEFTSLLWFYMVAGADGLAHVWLRYLLWAVFLLYSGVALVGMSYLSAGLWFGGRFSVLPMLNEVDNLSDSEGH